MVIKATPLDGEFQMDEETAIRQIALVDDAQKVVDALRVSMVNLGEGQTALVWTADGKSVDLTAELKTRYDSAQQWLDSISAELALTRDNVGKSISTTKLMSEQQKHYYQNLLYRTHSSSNGPIAV